MAAVGSTWVTVTPSAKNFGRDLNKQVQGQAAGIGKKLTSSIGGAAKVAVTAAAGAIVAGVGAVIGSGSKFNNAMATYQAKFAILTDGADGVGGAMARAAVEATKMQSTMDKIALAGAATQLLSAGVAAYELEHTLLMLAKAAMDQPDAMRALTKYYAMARQGIELTAVQMDALTARGFNPAAVAAEAMGKTLQEFEAYARRAGMSTSDILIKALELSTAEGGRFADALNIMAETAEGAISRTQNAFLNFAAAFTGGVHQVGGDVESLQGVMIRVLNQGLFPMFEGLYDLAKGSEGLKRMWATLGDVVIPLSEAMGDRVLDLGERFFGWLDRVDFTTLKDGLDGVGNLIAPLLAIITQWGGKILALIPGIGSHFGMLKGPIGFTIGLFIQMWRESETLREAVGTLFTVFIDLMERLSPLITIVGELLATLAGIAGDLLGRAIETILIPALELMVTVIEFLMPYIEQFTNWLGDAARDGGPLADIIFKIAVGFMALKKAIALTKTVTALFKTVKATLIGFLKTSKAILVTKKVAKGAWKAITIGATIAKKAFNLVLKANPIMKIISLIMLLVGALIHFFTQTETGQRVWQAFSDFITRVWEGIKNFISTAMEAIRGVIETVTGAIRSAWETAWGAIRNAAETVWNAITSLINFYINLVRQIIDIVMNLLRGNWGDAWNGIRDLVLGVWESITNIVRSAIEFVQNIIGNVMGFIGGIWSSAWEGISNTVSRIWDRITRRNRDGANEVAADVETGMSSAADSTERSYQRMESATDQTWQYINQATTVGTNTMTGAIGAGFGSATSTMESEWTRMQRETDSGWTTIGSATLTGTEQMNRTMTGGMNTAFHTIDTDMTRIGATIDDGWKDITNVTDLAMTDIGAHIDDGWMDSLQSTTKGWGEMTTATYAGAGDVVHRVGQLPQQLGSAMDPAKPIMFSQGQQLIQALINGINSKAGALQAAVNHKRSIAQQAASFGAELPDGGYFTAYQEAAAEAYGTFEPYATPEINNLFGGLTAPGADFGFDWATTGPYADMAGLATRADLEVLAERLEAAAERIAVGAISLRSREMLTRHQPLHA